MQPPMWSKFVWLHGLKDRCPRVSMNAGPQKDPNILKSLLRGLLKKSSWFVETPIYPYTIYVYIYIYVCTYYIICHIYMYILYTIYQVSSTAALVLFRDFNGLQAHGVCHKSDTTWFPVCPYWFNCHSLDAIGFPIHPYYGNLEVDKVHEPRRWSKTSSTSCTELRAHGGLKAISQIVSLCHRIPSISCQVTDFYVLCHQ